MESRTYAQILDDAVTNSGLSCEQIAMRCRHKYKTNVDRSYIGKLRKGAVPPARDEINIALSEVLSIPNFGLRVAALQETVPAGLLELLIQERMQSNI